MRSSVLSLLLVVKAIFSVRALLVPHTHARCRHHPISWGCRSIPPSLQGHVLSSAASTWSEGDDAPRPGSMEAARIETGKVPYGEASRPYRRTIFRGNADWVKHRHPDRIFLNLRKVFSSGVARQLARPVCFLSSVALAVVVWNASPVSVSKPWLQLRLPLQPFSFSASALSLLLVFRTNASYQRWLEAQNNISRINSQLKNILRMTSTWIAPVEDESVTTVQEIGLACWAVLRSLQNHLRSSSLDGKSFATHVQKTLDPDVAEKLIQAKDKPFWAVQDLSAAIRKLPIDDASKREMDKSIVIILGCIESCTQILRYPVPVVYSRHAARFLASALVLLPLALYDAFASSWNHILLVPATAIISFFFLGIDELAIQLEEPFSILPLEYSCAELKRRTRSAVKWHVAQTE